MAKLCVVTGTSSGIGAALARILLERGWEVIGVSRREAEITHDAYRNVSLDFSDPEAVQAYFEGEFPGQVRLEDYERVGLVNNAAVLGTVGPQEDLPLADMARAFNINAVTPTWLMGFFIKHCRRARLLLVNVSSGLATSPRAGLSTYCISKAALRMAGLVAAEDLQDFGAYEDRREHVAIVSYSPGTVATAMQEDMRSNSEETLPSVQWFVDLHEQNILKSAGQPSEHIASLLDRNDLPLHSEISFGR